jgi:hypothetical protein
LNKEQVRKGLKNSIFDGMAASAAGGLTTNYITPYALPMQATTQQIGYLTSISNFATMLALFWNAAAGGTRQQPQSVHHSD